MKKHKPQSEEPLKPGRESVRAYFSTRLSVEEEEKAEPKNSGFFSSLGHAVDGLLYTAWRERNMRIDLIVAALVLFSSLFFSFSRIELMLLCFAIIFVLLAETFNTAVERLCDFLVGDVYDKRIKIIKDVAAGATLLAAINAIIVGYLLYFDKLIATGGYVYRRIRSQYLHTTFIVIALVLLCVFILKVLLYRGHGRPLQGGSVSGHTALAFCLVTILFFISDQPSVGFIGLVLAVIVAESRAEAKIHSVSEIIAGALLGGLIAGIIFWFFTRFLG